MRNESNIRDPYWCQVRYACKCASCLKPIKVGESGFYYPASRAMYCNAINCGQNAALDFQTAKQDEEFMVAQFGGR